MVCGTHWAVAHVSIAGFIYSRKKPHKMFFLPLCWSVVGNHMCLLSYCLWLTCASALAVPIEALYLVLRYLLFDNCIWIFFFCPHFSNTFVSQRQEKGQKRKDFPPLKVL